MPSEESGNKTSNKAMTPTPHVSSVIRTTGCRSLWMGKSETAIYGKAFTCALFCHSEILAKFLDIIRT